MPSPLGHLLAGWSVAVAADEPRKPAGRFRWLTPVSLLAAFLAAGPDLDLFVLGWHRTATHSLAATALLMILAMAVTGKVTGKINWRIVAIVGAAHASHLLMDWLGTDPSPPEGVQLLWPFRRTYFISNWTVFPRTERRFSDPTFFTANLWAAAVELGVMLPIASASWWWATRKRKNRDRISVPADRRQPSA